MSTDTFEAELDDILGELTTDFTKKRKKKKPSSASSTFHKPHDKGAVSETLRTIMDLENPPPRIILPTTSSNNNSKRSINSAAESSTAKIQRLDDDEVVDLFAQRKIDELEEELYDIYIVNDEQPLQEDDGVVDERDVVGLAPSGKSVGIIGFCILVIFCAFCINVYLSACTCYRPYLSRHGSETSRTSSNALIQCGR